MNLGDLKQPFDPADIEFRAGATTKSKDKALALPYITSRAVMDRLDCVCGPENWRDEFREGPGGGVICGISIKVNNEWVTKWDGADNTQFEAVKGGLSDAFKRAAVKWGIGRYLYALPAVWVKAEERGKSVVVDENEARTRLFGGQAQQAVPLPQSPAVATAVAKRGKKPLTFKTLDDFLFRLNQDFGLKEAEAKDILKALGFTGWPTNGGAQQKRIEMYQAVETWTKQEMA